MIRERLAEFIADASPEQMRAWKDAIKPLQDEVDEVLVRDKLASSYSAILEYELPLDARRPDVILLVGAGVMVVELKGKITLSQADLSPCTASHNALDLVIPPSAEVATGSSEMARY